MKSSKDLAECILGMSYSTLRGVAGEFARMVEDKDARPQMETTEGFAELLLDWAEFEADNAQ